MGPTPGHTLVDRRPVHIHQRPAIPSNTLATNRRLDFTDTVSTEERQRVLCVSGGHDASDRTRDDLNRCG